MPYSALPYVRRAKGEMTRREQRLSRPILPLPLVVPSRIVVTVPLQAYRVRITPPPSSAGKVPRVFETLQLRRTHTTCE